MGVEQGLARTRGGFLARLFGRAPEERVTEEWLGALEESLVRADLSVTLVDSVMLQVRDVVRDGKATTVPKVLDAVRDALVAVLARGERGLRAAPSPPRVILVVGVNGSGKTTTAAKLAKRLLDAGERPLLAAADTFRAAAIDQLERWGERIGVPVIAGRPDGDPAAVVFDAVNAASARGHTTVVADTAGRLHNRGQLMEELGKIVRVTSRAREGAPDEVLLVLDGTQGQNAIVQAREFTKAANVTGIVVTKLDGTARGGAVFAIADELGLPVKLLGVGEKADDLVPLEPREFVDAMLPVAEEALRRLGPVGEDALSALHLDLREPPDHGDRPHVALNFVMTADGRASFHGRAEIGTRTDRHLMFHLRSLVDAVMTGAGTLRADPFTPTVKGRERQPLAIVVSGSAALPLANRFFSIASPRLVATTERAPQDAVRAIETRGVEVLRLGRDDVDLVRLLSIVRERGVRSLLCEGGPRLAGALLAARLVDELFLTHATLVTAEPDAKRLFETDLRPPPMRLERASLHEGPDGERYERARVTYSS